MTTAHGIFWLTHYTYNTINPLIDEAKAIEPTSQLGIETVFGHKEARYTKQPHVSVNAHWGRDGMLGMSGTLRNKTDVDRFADSLRAKIDKLKAPVEEDRRDIEDSLASL